MVRALGLVGAVPDDIALGAAPAAQRVSHLPVPAKGTWGTYHSDKLDSGMPLSHSQAHTVKHMLPHAWEKEWQGPWTRQLQAQSHLISLGGPLTSPADATAVKQAHLRAQHACCCLLAAEPPYLPISVARNMAFPVLRRVPHSLYQARPLGV